MVSPENPDTELIRQFLDGNEHAFNILVRRHQDFVYNITRKLTGNHDDAMEAAQRVFVKVYDRLGSFDFRSAFTTWLYRVATNEALNLLRAHRIRRWFSFDEVGELPSDKVNDPYTLMEWSESTELIERALQKLPARQRAVFVLRMMEGLSYEEISEILETGIGGLKASFHHAIKKMNKELASDYENE
jgi:RNA polymerase sigma factor (sigma-70 family)